MTCEEHNMLAAADNYAVPMIEVWMCPLNETGDRSWSRGLFNG